jgi:hypothetical protein
VELTTLIPHMVEQFMSRDKVFKAHLRRNVSARATRTKADE